MTEQVTIKEDGQRYEDERDFHNKAFSGDVRKSATKYYSIIEKSRQYYHTYLMQHGAGKRVLEYGCGPGSAAFRLAAAGADVTGIDISDVAIQQAKDTAVRKGVTGTFVQMNAEAMTFPDSSYDLVCGTGILHHLELERSYKELARVMHPKGSAMFVEPMGHNPVINLYRTLTPKMRTEDEHPFKMHDFTLAEKYFGKVDVQYFHMLVFAAVPFRRTPLFQPLMRALDSVDNAIMSAVPYLKRHAWMAVVALSEPRGK